MELNLTPSDTGTTMEYSDNSSDCKYVMNNNEQYSVIRIPEDSEKSSKHSSRKQSKRRKKSSNHTRTLPRIIVKPLPPPPPPETREWMAASSYTEPPPNTRPSTMREVLASIPGFCLKPRKRNSKKLSTAAQLQQTREGCIDLETPDSILVNTNIRALLNKHTFSLLPPLYQYKLGQLLPSVDRLTPSGRLNSSSLNNEFFARACIEWQESLSGGEFTPENQQKMKTEAEREKSKIDPWKIKHFEPFWGEKLRKEKSSVNLNSERPSLKTTIKLRPTASITSSSTVPKIKKNKSSSTSKRMRSVGAVTRSSCKTDEITDDSVGISTKSSAPVPDLLPIKHIKNQTQSYEECQVDFNFSDSSSTQRIDDSVSSTPVDPLLLPDTVSDRTELKQESDISAVTIEDSILLKDSPKVKEDIIDSDSNSHEPPKRLSDDNEEYNTAKRIRFEGDYAMDNASFMPHNTDSSIINYSDTETNYGNEQVCPNNEILYVRQDHPDTNSEDSKATPSGYEYDERSESSISSLKIESHNITNVTVAIEESENIETACGEHSIEDAEDNKENEKKMPLIKDVEREYMPITIQETTETVQTDSDDKETLKLIEVTNEVPCHNLKNMEEENIEVPPKSEKSLNKNEIIENTEKCGEKPKLPQNDLNSYDDHFKDAESYILETGLNILTSQSDDVKYTAQPNLMEVSSYISETNVTAVVTMPLSHHSSIPMMEVANTPIVSYPDDSTQDPAKPKTSAVQWKNENNWTNTESNMGFTTFETMNTLNTKNVSEDTKACMDDINTNDDPCIYKDDRDANFNMESSNSSESCQSMKDVAVKQELDIVPSLVSSANITNVPHSGSLTHIARSLKKSKIGKESNRSRSSNKVPPGAVNLERSYQICQAVIQNSPNRDALRGQLRPPPALLSRPARALRPPAPSVPQPHPLLLRQLPVSVMAHTEVNENRPNNMGQYILVQRTPNVVPRASSAPPANQNTNVSIARCRSVGAEDSCVCNLRAMILCKKCGAFCHDDCIGSAELCLTCFIR
ncbi:polycomb protein Asx [Bombyx mori]|uniref:DEUBAD domain-containing protein n=1 Tax=Bombyx mori TaxID=7091 RepID=A0A8R2APW7_BOMMO|nr:polycomb protein Asx [Bombyx mori]